MMGKNCEERKTGLGYLEKSPLLIAKKGLQREYFTKRSKSQLYKGVKKSIYPNFSNWFTFCTKYS